MFISIVIPTYNRLPILEKCLNSLEEQRIDSKIEGFEIIVVDDGSTDGTQAWLGKHLSSYPHVRLISQEHGGPAKARNRGVENSLGDVIVFIDSDLVVDKFFLVSHATSLRKACEALGNRYCFTYGAVINTNNFENLTSESLKLQDISWAYFATGNVAIHKNILQIAGLFDVDFSLYGWEDLELGERLRQMGVKLIRCPKAIGYHWHPSLTLDQIPNLIRIERERAKMGLVFFRKHPSFRVRCIIQFTVFHLILWELLTLGGILNERSMRPLLAFLIRSGHSSLAMELLRIPLNRIGVRQLYIEASLIGI